jgi:hypothetical protein
MVNTRHSWCSGQPSNNNNDNTNNTNLEQLLNTQNQLMQAMLQTLNNMQPAPQRNLCIMCRTKEVKVWGLVSSVA